jgi:TonB-dependent starch-binding outer membrane protein SusC
MKRKVITSLSRAFRFVGNKVLLLLVFSLLQLIAFPLLAQTHLIKGIVSDVNGPLQNVSVVVKGNLTGVNTDSQGRFSINTPLNATLIFSSVGYKTENVEVAGRNIINVVMTGEAKSLGEVVVVGYGTSKKATVTGSISTVSGDKLQTAPSVNFSNDLIGRLPGLVATTPSGEPGNDDAVLRIRGSNTLGNNSPLIVIDGIANRNMQRLDPADVESVTVLKDASAAIYGAEAANGVILVMTKRGSIGKPRISVSLNHAITKPTVLPKMADAATYGQMLTKYKNLRTVRNLINILTQTGYQQFSNPVRSRTMGIFRYPEDLKACGIIFPLAETTRMESIKTVPPTIHRQISGAI